MIDLLHFLLNFGNDMLLGIKIEFVITKIGTHNA